METAGYFFIAPSSSDIPKLMGKLAQKYEELITQPQAQENAHVLAAWAMITTAVLHPFYEGNGRVARAILPYTLRRLNMLPQYVENKDKKAHTSLDDATTAEIGKLYETGGLYPQQMKEGGIEQALAHAKTIPPTYEHVTTYQQKLYNVLEQRVDVIDWEQLLADENLANVAALLRIMPFEL